MKVQAVPSLRLYGFTKRKTKRIRLRRLALLFMRVGFITAIALLLAQPYITAQSLIPLPPVAGDHEDALVAAIIIDDSISSLHAVEGLSRLEQSKKTIRGTIEKLPDSCGISFCLTTSPYPSPVMTKKEAIEYLGRVASIPHEGNALTAIRQTVRQFSGQPVAILVSASRNKGVWEDYGERAVGDGSMVNMFFHDTSDILCPAYLIGKRGDIIRVGGDSDSLKDQPLSITNEDGERVLERSISAHEALLGEVAIDSKALKGERWLASTGEGRHQWQSLYFQGQSVSRSSKNVAIIRNSDEQSIRVDKLLTGIILSFHNDADITHLDPAQKKASPEATVIVVVGEPTFDPAVLPWLEQRIESGVRVLALPSEKGPSAGPDYPAFLPKWSAPISLQDDEFPLVLEAVSALPGDELTVLEVRQMKPGKLCIPQFSGPEEVLLRTRSQAVLVRKQLNPLSTCWALGTPFDSNPESVIWHPAFPFLIDTLLFPDATNQEARLGIDVGTIVKLDEWFGGFTGDAKLDLPDGESRVVKSTGGATDSLTVEAAGVYSLRHNGGVVYRVANSKREPDHTLVEKQVLADALTGYEVQWTGNKFSFPPDAYNRLAVAEGQNAHSKTKRYDLSQLVFWALLVFLVFEGVLSYAGWRQRSVLSQ